MRDVGLRRRQLLANRQELSERVLVDLAPLRFVVLADRVPQLGLGQSLCGAGFLLLQLDAMFFALEDQLAGGLGVGLELFGDGEQAGLVVGLDARAHACRRRIGRLIQPRDPGLVLAALFEQPLNGRCALG